MVNCNPETVSTDYDTSDRLYFEPLTLEDVLGVVEVERPEGVIVQFGGQTPLKLATRLGAGGREDPRHERRLDRPRRGARALRRLLERLGYSAPPYAAAQARRRGARRAGDGRLPVARAPVLRARRPRDGDRLLARRPRRLPRPHAARDGRDIFLDRFLENAIEVDVDALCDGERGLGRRDHAARRGGRRSTPATRRACCRRTRSGRTCSTRSGRHARDRAGARRGRAHERAVRRRQRASCT